jgi:hypothetical protein
MPRCMRTCNKLSWGVRNFIHYHHSIFPQPSFHFFVSFTSYEHFFSNISFPTILCCTLLYKPWYTYWHDSKIYKTKGFLILSDVLLMHIDSIHFPVNIWENYYHKSKRTSNKMNVVNTRTNILYINGFHTRTNHKKMPVVTHVNPILENIHYHHSKPTIRCQNFLRRSMHGFMRTCNKLSWGVCWGS